MRLLSECWFVSCCRLMVAFAIVATSSKRSNMFASCWATATPAGRLTSNSHVPQQQQQRQPWPPLLNLGPVRRSVSVSTSTVSSARLQPPIALIAQSSDYSSDATAAQGLAQAQMLPHDIRLAGKIREFGSGAFAAPLELSADQIKRRREELAAELKKREAANQQSSGWQWLRPRRAGDPQAENTRPAPQMQQSLQERSASSDEPRGGLRTILRGAKSLLSGGLATVEQRAGGLLWLGSNLLATLIPIVSLLGLPASTAAGSGSSAPPPLTGSNNSTQTRRSWMTERLVNTFSSLANGQQLAAALAAVSNGGGSGGAGAGLQGRVEYFMGLLERSVEHLPSFPRLHPQECVKRSICEAHHEPNKYGAIGLTLRLLFPASPTNGSELEMDNMEYKVINKYRHAAGYGHSRRIDSNGNNLSGAASPGACKDKYDDCLVSLLEVGQKLLDYFLR